MKKGLVLQINKKWLLEASYRRKMDRERRQREQAEEAAARKHRAAGDHEGGKASETRRVSRVDSPSRLVRLLGMLGSEHDGEVLNAARLVEAERKKLGKAWDQLVRLDPWDDGDAETWLRAARAANRRR